MTSTKVSIIIPSYTSERFEDIAELLHSVYAQTHKNIETLIVTQQSQELSDSIRQFIADKRYHDMQVLHDEGSLGVSSARNLAIRQAKGDIIAFVDDDALLYPDWAEEMVKTYDEDTTVISVTGPILPLWQSAAMNWFPKEFYWIFSCTYWDMLEKTEIRNGYGTNLSFRREAFEAAGLLSTSIGIKGWGRKGWRGPGAEETEFSIRVRRKTNKRIIYNPKVRVNHKVYHYRMTLNFIARRAYWEGYAKAMLSRLHSSDRNTDVLSVERALLGRVLFRLLPQIAGRLFSQPLTALRQLGVTTLVLSWVAIGYLQYKLVTLMGRGQPPNGIARPEAHL